MTCFAQMGQFNISSSKASGVSASAIAKPLTLAGNVPGPMQSGQYSWEGSMHSRAPSAGHYKMPSNYED